LPITKHRQLARQVGAFRRNCVRELEGPQDQHDVVGEVDLIFMGIFFVDITLGNSADRDGELRQPVSVGAPRYDYMTGSHGDSLRRLAISRVSMRLVGH
jgi:hypothetical protein